MNKQMQKLKKQRRLERLSEKDKMDAAEIALRYGIVITLQAVKDIFKDRASNKKCEDLVCRILKLWEDTGEKKVSIKTIADSVEMECGIHYDMESGNIYNVRRK